MQSNLPIIQKTGGKVTEFMLHGVSLSMFVSTEEAKGHLSIPVKTISLWKEFNDVLLPVLTFNRSMFHAYCFNEKKEEASYYLIAAGIMIQEFETYFFNISQILNAYKGQEETTV